MAEEPGEARRLLYTQRPTWGDRSAAETWWASGHDRRAANNAAFLTTPDPLISRVYTVLLLELRTWRRRSSNQNMNSLQTKFIKIKEKSKMKIETESRSGDEISRKVCLTVFSRNTPAPWAHLSSGMCHRSPDRSKQTETSPHHVTRVTFTLTGTEELGQKLHYRIQHLHKVSDAFKENLQKTLTKVWSHICVFINWLNYDDLLGSHHPRLQD